MELYLLKAFHFRECDNLPYRKDGRGGHTFYGAGSHVLFSDLRHRWYRFVIEVATVGQPVDSEIVGTRLRAHCDGKPINTQQSQVDWQGDYRRLTMSEELSSYQWHQRIQFDLKEPALVSISVEMKFSDQSEYLPVDGLARVLVDMHAGEPPKHYSTPMWYLKKWLGERS